MNYEQQPESDASRIWTGITEALEAERPITEDTARLIASQLHGGQASALYSFTSAGYIDRARIEAELEETHREQPDNHEMLRWSLALSEYLASKEEAMAHPKVWVACLAAYNNGYLHGEWVDAAVEPEELWESINHVLATSPIPNAEEWAFHDYENFEGLRIGEYEGVERTTQLARFIASHGRPFALWFEHNGGYEPLEDAGEAFEGSFVGQFDTEGSMQDRLYDSLGIEHYEETAWQHLPDWVENYMQFNMESYTHDMICGGELFVIQNEYGIFAFWNH